MIDLKDFEYHELEEFIVGLGEKKFRAGQIYKSIMRGLDFNEMSDLSLSLREKLAENFVAVPLKILKSVKSVDGTEKFLFALTDDINTETLFVFLRK